jgi:lysozyme
MNDYQPSSTLIEFLKTSEGCRLTPYVDIAGYTTWGYGHKARPGEAVPSMITEQQADNQLIADAGTAGDAVRSLVTAEMTQGQFDGFTEFAFNLGSGALAGSTMLRLFNAGNVQGAAQECLKWDHAHVAGQVVELAALKARRAWDAVQISPSVEAKAWTPEGEIKDAPLVFPPIDMPPQDGAANIPTLTDMVPTPQQIEALAALAPAAPPVVTTPPDTQEPVPDPALMAHPVSDPATAPTVPAVP